jgi:hypothetical protein
MIKDKAGYRLRFMNDDGRINWLRGTGEQPNWSGMNSFNPKSQPSNLVDNHIVRLFKSVNRSSCSNPQWRQNVPRGTDQYICLAKGFGFPQIVNSIAYTNAMAATHAKKDVSMQSEYQEAWINCSLLAWTGDWQYYAQISQGFFVLEWRERKYINNCDQHLELSFLSQSMQMILSDAEHAQFLEVPLLNDSSVSE